MSVETPLMSPVHGHVFIHIVKKISLFLSRVIIQVSQTKNEMHFKQELLEFLRQNEAKFILHR